MYLMQLPKVSLEEMWRTIEAHGFDRKKLEQTDPDYETILKLYNAIKEIKKKQESNQTPKWMPNPN